MNLKIKDPRSENWLKNAPNLVETQRGWELHGFVPLATAANYPRTSHRKAFIYGFHYDGLIKIGRSSDPAKRLQGVQRRFGPHRLEIVGAEEVPYAGSIFAERLMHVQFEDKMLKREWFDLSPEDFLGFLPFAVIGAKLYDEACREWWQAQYPNGEE